MRIGYARTTIDRSTRTSVVISFGLVGRARSQSSCHRMDRVFVAEFEVAGSSFVGRSLADSRHATLLLFLCRGRDVSCVDFVSIIHPDYRPEPRFEPRFYTARAYYDPTAESRLGFGQRRSSLAYFWNGLEPNIAT